MEEVSDVVHPGATRGVRTLAWVGLVIIVGSMVGIVIAFFFQGGNERKVSVFVTIVEAVTHHEFIWDPKA